MQVLCLYGPRRSKPRLRSELRKQQYTVTLFDCNHLAHLKVLWQMQKFMCYCTVFALFYFEFESNFRVQAPGGLYLEDYIWAFCGVAFFAMQVVRHLFSL